MSAARPLSGPNLLRHAQQRLLRARPRDALPLSISHERIYILPSKRGWVFVLSLLIMLIASMNYVINLGYALCFLLAGLFASSLLATYRNLAGLQIDSIQTANTFADEPVYFGVHLSNRHKRERPGIRITHSGGRSSHVDLAPKSRLEAVLKVPDSQRGRLSLGRLTLSSDYPLGLWHAWCYVHTPCEALIYPAPEHDAPPWPSTLVNGRQGRYQQADDGEDEFDQLKPFVPGEPLSRVAWKTAARGQGWYSKHFEPETSARELILRLADTRPAVDTERRLSRLCAWILRAEREQRDYALELPGYHSGSGHGQIHRDAQLEQLALRERLDE